MCHTQVKYQAATVKRKHKANGKMMQVEQKLNKNTGKAIQAKTSKKCRQTTDTGQKNKCMKNTRLTSIQSRLLKFPTVTSTNTSQYQ